MAFLAWPTAEIEFTKRKPIGIITYLELDIPSLGLYYFSDVRARLDTFGSQTLPFNIAVASWSTHVYESSWINRRDVITNITVTMTNREMDRRNAATLESFRTESAPTPGRRWWPKISDILSAVTIPSSIYARVLIAVHTVFEQRELFVGIVDTIEYNAETVVLKLVRDRRWNDTIPRNVIEDRQTALAPQAGVPVNTHYGRWGNRTQLASNTAASFRPFGGGTPSAFDEPDSGGGFRSPCPITPEGEGVLQDDESRQYILLRHFPFDSVAFTFGLQLNNAYMISGSTMSRLRARAGPDAGITAETISDTDIWPTRFSRMKFDLNTYAEMRMFPDEIESPGWSTSDSFGNVIDGLMDTWAKVSVVGAATESCTFVFNNTQAAGGLVDDLYAVIDLWADSDPPGNAFQGGVAVDFTYGNGLNITTSGVIDQTTGQHPNMLSLVLDLGAAIDPSGVNNGIYTWDFTYDLSGTRTPCTYQIDLSRNSGANTIDFYIKSVYLLVVHKPFLRFIDDDLVRVPREDASLPQGSTDEHGAYVNVYKRFFEPIRNLRPRVFVDSDGVQDYATDFSGFAPYEHFYADESPVEKLIENPCRIAAHILDSFGTGRRDATNSVITTSAAKAKWAQGDILGNFDKAADDLDSYVDVITNNSDTVFRTHWLIDREESITSTVYRLANECQFNIETYETSNATSIGGANAPGAPLRELFGAWVPVPLIDADNDGNFNIPFTGNQPPIGPGISWRDGDVGVEMADIIDTQIGFTDLSKVVNAVQINFAYDYTRNRYMRTLKADHESIDEPQPFIDPNDIATFLDQGLCEDSFATYGQQFKRIINLRSVYRWHEAAVIRSLVLQQFFRQRIMLKLTVQPQLSDLAVPGLTFQLSGPDSTNSTDWKMLFATKQQMLFPGAAFKMETISNSTNASPRLWNLNVWFRVVRYQYNLNHPQSITIWAVEGI